MGSGLCPDPIFCMVTNSVLYEQETGKKINFAIAEKYLPCHNCSAKKLNPFKRRAGWQKTFLTRRLLTISDSRCRRRVGRTDGCSIKALMAEVGHLTLLGGLRRLRGLRQTGVLVPSVVFIFAILNFVWIKSL